jgi:carbon storage regulator
MLVLTRKTNQRIVIGNNIEIVVVGVHGGRVSLGFEAPEDVAIRRHELRSPCTTDRPALVSAIARPSLDAT